MMLILKVTELLDVKFCLPYIVKSQIDLRGTVFSENNLLEIN